jgi:hypothetical protein
LDWAQVRLKFLRYRCSSWWLGRGAMATPPERNMGGREGKTEKRISLASWPH